MHPIITTFFLFLLSPFNWILLFIVLSFVIKKRRRKQICYFAAIIIFLVFSNGWLLNWYVSKWQPGPPDLPVGIDYSCGIVLGGFASPDEKGAGYFNTAADRFIQAVELYKKGIIKHLLISGGNGKLDDKHFQEGAWVKKQLGIMGVPDSVIIIEDRSVTTADNARYAGEILDSIGLKPPYVLITSALHMPRASMLFKGQGLAIIPFPCNYREGRGKLSFASFWPSPSVLSDWSFYTKETAGYLWYKLGFK
jgi:uncharacterized SAM-binding protein YcdF (DUF218 family)